MIAQSSVERSDAFVPDDNGSLVRVSKGARVERKYSELLKWTKNEEDHESTMKGMRVRIPRIILIKWWNWLKDDTENAQGDR